MKETLQFFAAGLFACISGCGFLCMGGTWTCGLSNEEAHRLLHPKTYGKYWEKDTTKKEEWSQDWQVCGGHPDGGFGAYRAPGMSDADLNEAYEEKRKNLDTCMKQKGYHFNRSSP